MIITATRSIPRALIEDAKPGELEQYIVGRVRQKMDEHWKAECARMEHLLVHGTGEGPRPVGLISATEGSGLA